MGVQPLACNCPRSPLSISVDFPVAAKARCGKVNASAVVQVGDGGLVAAALLDPELIPGSEYDGYFRQVTVVAAYPISQWIPPTQSEPGYWSRVRTLTKTWTRNHSGENVIPCSSAETFTDEYEEEGYPIAYDEEITPGDDEDPANFGDGNIDLLLSTIEVTTEISKSDLLSYVANLPEQWSNYFEVAPNEFASLGIAAGIIFWGGYETEDKPYQASRLDVKWTASATHDEIIEEGVSSYFIGEPGLTIKSTAEIRALDDSLEEPIETVEDTIINVMPWRINFNRWSKSKDLTNPNSENWLDLNLNPTPGLLKLLVGYHYQLDVGSMFSI